MPCLWFFLHLDRKYTFSLAAYFSFLGLFWLANVISPGLMLNKKDKTGICYEAVSECGCLWHVWLALWDPWTWPDSWNKSFCYGRILPWFPFLCQGEDKNIPSTVKDPEGHQGWNYGSLLWLQGRFNWNKVTRREHCNYSKAAFWRKCLGLDSFGIKFQAIRVSSLKHRIEENVFFFSQYTITGAWKNCLLRLQLRGCEKQKETFIVLQYWLCHPSMYSVNAAA